MLVYGIFNNYDTYLVLLIINAVVIIIVLQSANYIKETRYKKKKSCIVREKYEYFPNGK